MPASGTKTAKRKPEAKTGAAVVGGSGKKRSKSAAEAAARSHQLGLSESVVVLCKFLMADLSNNELVMMQGPKRIQSLVNAIKARMTDKVMSS